MLGIEDYSSDVESGNGVPSMKQSLPSPAPSKFSGLSSSSSSLSLPPPTNAKAKRPKKFGISLPMLPSHDSDTDAHPPAKKPRITSRGAGASPLLSMLPAPMQPLPVKSKKDKEPERMLGGGGGPGFVFRAPASVPDDGEEAKEASTSFLPPSLKTGKSNVVLDREDFQPQALPKVSSAPAVDFFYLSSTSFSGGTPCILSSLNQLTKTSATPQFFGAPRPAYIQSLGNMSTDTLPEDLEQFSSRGRPVFVLDSSNYGPVVNIRTRAVS